MLALPDRPPARMPRNGAAIRHDNASRQVGTIPPTAWSRAPPGLQASRDDDDARYTSLYASSRHPPTETLRRALARHPKDKSTSQHTSCIQGISNSLLRIGPSWWTLETWATPGVRSTARFSTSGSVGPAARASGPSLRRPTSRLLRLRQPPPTAEAVELRQPSAVGARVPFPREPLDAFQTGVQRRAGTAPGNSPGPRPRAGAPFKSSNAQSSHLRRRTARRRRSTPSG